MIGNFNFILISLRFSASLELYHWEISFHEWLSRFIMVKSNGWKICVIVDDAGTIWVWCSYWAFSFTIQRKLLQFYQVILLTPQSQLSVWGLIWEVTNQVNMESFGFSLLHELATRSLFESWYQHLIKLSFCKYKLQTRRVWCLSWRECDFQLVWAVKGSHQSSLLIISLLVFFHINFAQF